MARRKAKPQSTPREQLELFVKRCEELSTLRLITSYGLSKVGSSIKGKAVPEGFQVTYEPHEPDEDDLRSFLLTFRQFISNDEPVFIIKIFKFCDHYLKDDTLKGELAKARAGWKEIIDVSEGLRVEVDGRLLTGEYVLDLWINGHYFHNDPDHVKELERLAKTAIRLDRAGFIRALSGLTQIIFNVGSVVAYGLKNDLFVVT